MDLDMPPAWSQACMCGRTFSMPHTHTYHMHTCLQMKKQLSSAMEKAREVLQVKKHCKMEDMIQWEASETSNHPVIDESSLTTGKVLLPTHQQVRFLLQPTVISYEAHQIPEMNCTEIQGLDQPLAEWRVQWQNCQLPKHYHDIAPKPPTSLLPASSQVASDCPWVDSEVFPAQPSPMHISPVKRRLKSGGLSCDPPDLSRSDLICLDPLRIWLEFFWPQMAVIGPNFPTRLWPEWPIPSGSNCIHLD